MFTEFSETSFVRLLEHDGNEADVVMSKYSNCFEIIGGKRLGSPLTHQG
jgi:hypothetical protein